MQLFFNTSSAISHGVLKYTAWNYVRAGLLRNLTTIQNYYYSRIFTVKSNHFLSRLINTMNVSHHLELERFYDIVDAKANIIAAAMKMTSSLNRGYLFNGVFYGQGCPEIIINDSTPFNPFFVYKNWKTTQAVKVVTHPRSDLSMLLPNGKATGTETGLAVISINIPMLAIQYKAFVADQIYHDAGDGTGLQTVSHFVHRFVLPNMLPSHLDFAIFNRISNLVTGAPMGESLRRHPFALVDYSILANKVQLEIIEGMKTRSMEYKAITDTIPAVYLPTMTEALRMPENAPTRQVTWANVLSRINAVKIITDLGGELAIHRNGAILNNFAREFKLYRQDNSISSFVPKDIYSDTLYQMQEIADLVNKKIS